MLYRQILITTLGGLDRHSMPLIANEAARSRAGKTVRIVCGYQLKAKQVKLSQLCVVIVLNI